MGTNHADVTFAIVSFCFDAVERGVEEFHVRMITGSKDTIRNRIEKQMGIVPVRTSPIRGGMRRWYAVADLAKAIGLERD